MHLTSSTEETSEDYNYYSTFNDGTWYNKHGTAVGTFSWTAGPPQPRCKLCTENFYRSRQMYQSDDTADLACKACPPGKQSTLTLSEWRSECKAIYSWNQRSEQRNCCGMCEEGKATYQVWQIAEADLQVLQDPAQPGCYTCTPGSFAAARGTGRCSTCPEHKFTPDPGQCETCPSGYERLNEKDGEVIDDAWFDIARTITNPRFTVYLSLGAHHQQPA